jgi:peroxiredoxin
LNQVSIITRGVLLLAAGLCLTAAAALVLSAGLPERAQYTGVLTEQGLVAPELDAIAPPFTATRLDGTQVSLLELRGTPVIINFWATWCAPCKAEMPQLQALYETYPEGEIRILAVNVGEDQASIAQWADQYGLTFDLLLDPAGQIAALYHLRGQPSTYVISPEGAITSVIFGPATMMQLEAALPATF